MEAKQSSQADTIVLVHGLWVTSLSWESWIDHYRKAGYNVIAPAYPGLDGAIEAAFPVLGHLSNRHKAVPVTMAQFQ
jgi:alpha-beta hydrolase superfamily lysophospholipase